MLGEVLHSLNNWFEVPGKRLTGFFQVEGGALTLPDGYAGLCSIDLQKDKRLALLINGLALLIALPLVFLGNRIVLLRTLFSMDDGFGFYFLRLGMLTAGYAAYVV
ncbi:MAG: hypothetical protein EGQ84_04265, partial [Slackia sp.]|nr:hypothetical protein [Slackia sp.]